MATAARLTAALSVAVGAALVLMSARGGFIVLLGWLSVGLLTAGLLLGHRGGVTAMAVGYTSMLGLQVGLDLPVQPVIWVQALLLTVSLEAASLSFTLRVRPVDPLTEMARGLGTALIVSGVVAALGIAVAGADAGGVLVRAAGIAALVVATGWVVRTWRRSGLV